MDQGRAGAKWWDELESRFEGSFCPCSRTGILSGHMLLVGWPFKKDVFSEKFGFSPTSICCSRIGTVLENPFN